ncbi:hypothetical protein FQR65_LT20095 [Abscondita terminalis]|nr:hypothetical protein FQR65_LT20095 [Abscondita terminalis]
MIFLAYSTTPLVARRRGAGDLRGAVQAGVDGLWLALGIGAVVGVGLWIAGGPLVDLFGADPGTAEQARSYLGVSALGIPAMLVVFAASGLLRGLQDTRTPLVVATIGFALNALLNWWFIYGLGLGIAGSAWGTVAAQWGMVAVYLAVIIRHARGAGAGFLPQRAGLGQAGRSGGWLFVRTVGLRAALLVTVFAATSHGTVATAGYQIVFTVFSTAAFALDALAIAAQALVGDALEHETRLAPAHVRRTVRWGIGAASGSGRCSSTASASEALTCREASLIASGARSTLQPLIMSGARARARMLSRLESRHSGSMLAYLPLATGRITMRSAMLEGRCVSALDSIDVRVRSSRVSDACRCSRPEASSPEFGSQLGARPALLRQLALGARTESRGLERHRVFEHAGAPSWAAVSSPRRRFAFHMADIVLARARTFASRRSCDGVDLAGLRTWTGRVHRAEWRSRGVRFPVLSGRRHQRAHRYGRKRTVGTEPRPAFWPLSVCPYLSPDGATRRIRHRRPHPRDPLDRRRVSNATLSPKTARSTPSRASAARTKSELREHVPHVKSDRRRGEIQQPSYFRVRVPSAASKATSRSRVLKDSMPSRTPGSVSSTNASERSSAGRAPSCRNNSADCFRKRLPEFRSPIARLSRPASNKT